MPGFRLTMPKKRPERKSKLSSNQRPLSCQTTTADSRSDYQPTSALPWRLGLEFGIFLHCMILSNSVNLQHSHGFKFPKIRVRYVVNMVTGGEFSLLCWWQHCNAISKHSITRLFHAELYAITSRSKWEICQEAFRWRMWGKGLKQSSWRFLFHFFGDTLMLAFLQIE